MAEETFEEEKENRVAIDDVPGRMLMGLDTNGQKRFLRCDPEGFLLCKAVPVDAEELEVTEE